MQIIDVKSFDTIPVDVWFPMVDGVGWVVEISEEDKQVIHFTNWPDEKIESAFQFLLHFTNYQKVDQANYRHGKIHINSRSEIVRESTLLDSVSNYLILNLPEEFSSQCSMSVFDLRMMLSYGRVAKVRHLSQKPFSDLGELAADIAVRVTERHCRRTIRDTLKGCDLSDFNLPKSWIEVFDFKIEINCLE